MKAITPLLISIFASTLLAQVETIGVTKVLFFGDKSKKQYYSIDCSGRSDIPAANFIIFTNTDASPEKQGFTLSSKCPGGKPPNKTSPMVVVLEAPEHKTESPSLATIASDFRIYRARLLERNVHISINTIPWGANGYGTPYSSFTINDGSTNEIVYALRDSRIAQKMRETISHSYGSVKIRITHRPKRQDPGSRFVFADFVGYELLED